MLMEHFSNSDSFQLPQDYYKLNWKLLPEDDRSSNEERELAIRAGLSDMEQDDFVRAISSGAGKNKKETWIVLNSLKNKGSFLELSRETSINIRDICLNFLPLLDINIEAQIDEKNLSEQEIQLLLLVIKTLGERVDNLQKELNSKIKSNHNKKEGGDEIGSI